MTGIARVTADQSAPHGWAYYLAAQRLGLSAGQTAALGDAGVGYVLTLEQPPDPGDPSGVREPRRPAPRPPSLPRALGPA